MSDKLAINQDSYNPLTGFGETSLPVYYIVKDFLKNTGEQPDDEVHKVRYGRVPSTGTSVPPELGCPTLPVCGCVH